MIRQQAEASGRVAEDLVVEYLQTNGWVVLARRYTTQRGSGAGEVDVIAEQAGLVAFIEVKARPSLRRALESVSPRQQQRIAAGANAWLARHPAYGNHDCRFDVVAVLADHSVYHVVDAWRVDF